MRQNKELAEKVGLLPGMKVYKFFQSTYGYCKNKRRYGLKEKISKPNHHSYVFINNEYSYDKKIKKKLAPYFLLKKRKLVLPNSTWQTKKNWQLVDIIRACLHFATCNCLKENYYWKPCDTNEDPIWTKGQGWKIRCPIAIKHHLEPIIRWEFEFKGSVAYAIFKEFIHPTLQLVNLPRFQKFSEYQASESDYDKFAYQAELPWNKEINKYTFGGESAKSPEWRKTIPLELVYNFVYLKEIRSKIFSSNFSPELSSEDAIARYADY